MTTLLERLGLRRQAREQEKSAGLAEYYKLLRADAAGEAGADAERLEGLMAVLGLEEADVRRDVGLLLRAAALAEKADQADAAREEHERACAAAAAAVEAVKLAEAAEHEASHVARQAGASLSAALEAGRDLAGLRQAHPQLLG